MARSLRCYYTGKVGMVCEHCPLVEQEYCGNYTLYNPLAPRQPASAPQEMRVSSGSKLRKIISALEGMGFKKS